MFEATALRHPEFISGSISQHRAALAARWMLKRVQHDVLEYIIAKRIILCATPRTLRQQNSFRAEAAEFRRDSIIINPLRASAPPREPIKSNLTRRRGDAEIHI